MQDRWELSNSIFGILIATNDADTSLDPPCLSAGGWTMAEAGCAISELSGTCDALECELTISQNIQSSCVDSVTGDYYTVTLNATAVNASGQYQVYLNGAQLGSNTNYGTPITLGNGLKWPNRYILSRWSHSV